MMYIVKIDKSDYDASHHDNIVVVKTFEEALKAIGQGTVKPTLMVQDEHDGSWTVQWSVSKQVDDKFMVKYGVACIRKIEW